MKKTFYILGILLTAVFFAGCVEMQGGTPKDLDYVPLNEIKVEQELPPVPEGMENATGEEPQMSVMGSEEEAEEITEEEMPLEEVEEEIMPEAEETAEEVTSEEPAEREIVIVLTETDLVNLKPVAHDPDADKLKFAYTTPLNEDGKWQTTYGDAGQYTVTITASDGELTSSKDALLIVNKKEETPTIDEQTPEKMEQTIDENSDITFTIKASDLNNDPLTYEWKLDGDVVSTTGSFTYKTDYSSAGSHTIKADVSDGTATVSMLWALTVNNVDRAPVLKVIPDITIKETETVMIAPQASDPDEDEIAYTISEPVGDDGIWKTTYDDSGVYKVKVTASDGELEDLQEVKVTVINVNRPPVIENIIQVD